MQNTPVDVSGLREKMIKVYVKGGLGNQLFQYAYGRAESLRKKTSLCIDTSDLLYPVYFREKETPRNFTLQHFNIQAEVISPKMNPYLKQIFRKLYEWVTKKERGYQSEKYFKDHEKAIRDDLKIITPLSSQTCVFLQKISSDSNSVSIHIRRGDYVKDQKAIIFHGEFDMDYYNRAVRKIIDTKDIKPSLYIFSDEIEWVKNNLKFDYPTVYVSGNICDYEELYLMSQCKHNIIANSTFSWWGAWLNQNPEKIVIAPSRWLAGSNISINEIIPDKWIKI